MMFEGDDNHCSTIDDLQKIINTELDKDYTTEQIIIGLDYAGFKREGDGYFVQLKSDLASG